MRSAYTVEEPCMWIGKSLFYTIYGDIAIFRCIILRGHTKVNSVLIEGVCYLALKSDSPRSCFSCQPI